MANTSKNAQKKGEIKEPANTAAEPQAKKATKVKPTDEVQVISCVYGKLIYESPRSGCRVEWNEFGAMELMTVEELVTMRSSQRAFFENQWIVLSGENASAVMKYLRVEQYYTDISDINAIDNLFRNDPKDLPGILGRFTPSAKETIARRAYDLIQQTQLSDINVIRVLEKELGYDLTT